MFIDSLNTIVGSNLALLRTLFPGRRGSKRLVGANDACELLCDANYRVKVFVRSQYHSHYAIFERHAVPDLSPLKRAGPLRLSARAPGVSTQYSIIIHILGK